MIEENFNRSRLPKQENIDTDLVVVGGGIAGVCTAITAARSGIKVVLVQDRPVLGGNSSSEVRLWVLGATSHMGNNNRWAREGGVIDEILIENTYRNKEGNPVIWDTILLDKVYNEPNITLLLNTVVHEVEKKNDHEIEKVSAFCSQTSIQYYLSAKFFSDCSGDGIVSFLAGASFRMGAESAEEFGELAAPNIKDYGELLGHSIFFYTKDVGKSVKFRAPSYAMKNPADLPKIRNFKLQDQGCRMWWVEYGGRLDTIHQTEEIKMELWKVLYGIWDHVKNSGDYPEADTLTLEWIGTIPGKRESRRFIGDYFMIQQDIVERRRHEDAVAFGGWAIDLHPADGVHSEKKGCTQYHAKGAYQIPYRCYYSKEINNLFFGGRIISVSHVAFGSTRVMATCGHGGQAVGIAASLAVKHGLKPRDLSKGPHLKMLQRELSKIGQSIPHIPIRDEANLVNSAKITASSTLQLSSLPTDGDWIGLEFSAAQMIPMLVGTNYKVKLRVKASRNTTLIAQLRAPSCEHYTPDITHEELSFELRVGEQDIELDFGTSVPKDQYGFVTLMKNEAVAVKSSKRLLPGILSVYNKINPAVSNFGKQEPEGDIGIETFEFWCPNRRPDGNNFAFEVSPTLDRFNPSNLNQGFVRPTPEGVNAWVPDENDTHPAISLEWPKPQEINMIRLFFDGDFDHPMESVLMGHYEDVMPLCVRNYTIKDSKGEVVFTQEGNYQSVNTIELEKPISTAKLTIELENPPGQSAVLYEVLCY